MSKDMYHYAPAYVPTGTERAFTFCGIPVRGVLCVYLSSVNDSWVLEDEPICPDCEGIRSLRVLGEVIL
jgi:hypothetical protein